jgi:hypothetical protein
MPQQSWTPSWGAQSLPNGLTAPFGYQPSYSAPQYFQPAYQPQYNIGYSGFGGYGGYGGYGGGFSPGGQQYMQQGLLGMAPRGYVAPPYDRAAGMMAGPAPYQQQDNFAKNIYTLFAPFQQSGPSREAQQVVAQQVASGTGDANQIKQANFAKAMNTMYAGNPPAWAQQPMQYGPNFFPQPQTSA